MNQQQHRLMQVLQKISIFNAFFVTTLSLCT
jgi:hypothetical protein